MRETIGLRTIARIKYTVRVSVMVVGKEKRKPVENNVDTYDVPLNYVSLSHTYTNSIPLFLSLYHCHATDPPAGQPPSIWSDSLPAHKNVRAPQHTTYTKTISSITILTHAHTRTHRDQTEIKTRRWTTEN